MADKSLWMDYPSDKSGDSSLLLGDVEAPFGMTDDFPPTPGPRARIKGKDNSSTILEGSPQRLKSAIDVWEEKQKGGQGEKGVEAILTESGKGVTSSNRSSAHSRFAGMGLAKEGSRPSPVSKGMKTSAFLAGVPSGKRVQSFLPPPSQSSKISPRSIPSLPSSKPALRNAALQKLLEKTPLAGTEVNGLAHAGQSGKMNEGTELDVVALRIGTKIGKLSVEAQEVEGGGGSVKKDASQTEEGRRRSVKEMIAKVENAAQASKIPSPTSRTSTSSYSRNSTSPQSDFERPQSTSSLKEQSILTSLDSTSTSGVPPPINLDLPLELQELVALSQVETEIVTEDVLVQVSEARASVPALRLKRSKESGSGELVRGEKEANTEDKQEVEIDEVGKEMSQPAAPVDALETQVKLSPVKTKHIVTARTSPTLTHNESSPRDATHHLAMSSPSFKIDQQHSPIHSARRRTKAEMHEAFRNIPMTPLDKLRRRALGEETPFGGREWGSEGVEEDVLLEGSEEREESMEMLAEDGVEEGTIERTVAVGQAAVDFSESAKSIRRSPKEHPGRTPLLHRTRDSDISYELVEPVGEQAKRNPPLKRATTVSKGDGPSARLTPRVTSRLSVVTKVDSTSPTAKAARISIPGTESTRISVPPAPKQIVKQQVSLGVPEIRHHAQRKPVVPGRIQTFIPPQPARPITRPRTPPFARQKKATTSIAISAAPPRPAPASAAIIPKNAPLRHRQVSQLAGPSIRPMATKASSLALAPQVKNSAPTPSIPPVRQTRPPHTVAPRAPIALAKKPSLHNIRGLPKEIELPKIPRKPSAVVTIPDFEKAHTQFEAAKQRVRSQPRSLTIPTAGQTPGRTSRLRMQERAEWDKANEEYQGHRQAALESYQREKERMEMEAEEEVRRKISFKANPLPGYLGGTARRAP